MPNHFWDRRRALKGLLGVTLAAPSLEALGCLAKPPAPPANDPSDEDADLILQPLIPALDWDFRPVPEGTTSAAQWQLCDRMPHSCVHGAPFMSSSDSFSEGYLALLDLLVEYRNIEAIRVALETARRPTAPPNASSNPPGWTKVPSGSGMYEWKPDWIVPVDPGMWIQGIDPQAVSDASDAGAVPPASRVGPASRADAGLSTPQERGVLAVPSSPASMDIRSKDGKHSTLLFAQGDILQMTVEAQAWGRIPIYPGAWYSSAVVAICKNGPFVRGIARERVFGPGGLLRCRVASMIVAHKPRIEMLVSNEFAERNAAHLEDATELSIGNVVLKGAGTSAAAPIVRLVRTAEGTSLTASTSSLHPSIVAMLLDRVP